MKSKALGNAALILGLKLFYFVNFIYLEALNLLHDFGKYSAMFIQQLFKLYTL